MVKTDNTHRSRDLVNKRLTAIRKRYYPNDKGNDKTFERIWRELQELKSRAEPTVDLDLLPKVDCTTRFEKTGTYYCCRKPPRKVKLDSLKICKICIEEKEKIKEKPPQSVIQKADVVLTKITGQSQEAETIYRTMYDKKLASGAYTRNCQIVKKNLKLFDLPCVVNSNKFNEKFGCRFTACEAEIMRIVKTLAT